MKILENNIQNEVCEWLKENNYFFWRQNSVGVYDPVKKSFRRIPKYCLAGLPDIMCVHNGFLIGIEVKRPNRNTGSRAAPYILSEHQKKIKDLFVKNGAMYVVVTSRDGIRDAMSAIPVPLPLSLS